jgi:hypothetical protein
MVGKHGRPNGREVCAPAMALSTGGGRVGEVRDKSGDHSIHNLFTTVVFVFRLHERERSGAKFRAQTFSALCEIFVKIA